MFGTINKLLNKIVLKELQQNSKIKDIVNDN